MTWKNWMLGVVLVGLAIVGPMVAYAGVSVIYPNSVHTVTVDLTPPITIDNGDDYDQGVRAGILSPPLFAGTNNNASFTITINPTSGANWTVDNYVWMNRTTQVASWELQVGAALTGTLTTPTIMKVRAWTGGTAPVADGSAGVCAVLSLLDSVNTESGTSCTAAGVKLQFTVTLPDASTGSSTVSLRPSSIAWA